MTAYAELSNRGNAYVRYEFLFLRLPLAARPGKSLFDRRVLRLQFLQRCGPQRQLLQSGQLLQSLQRLPTERFRLLQFPLVLHGRLLCAAIRPVCKQRLRLLKLPQPPLLQLLRLTHNSFSHKKRRISPAFFLFAYGSSSDTDEIRIPI